MIRGSVKGDMRMRRSGSCGAALTLLLALSAPWAEAATGPTDQLKSAIEMVVKIVDDPALKGEGRAPERRRAVRKVANDIFDFPEIARRALARHWQPLSDKQ